MFSIRVVFTLSSEAFRLYEISFMYTAMLGFLTTCILGIIFSLIMGELITTVAAAAAAVVPLIQRTGKRVDTFIPVGLICPQVPLSGRRSTRGPSYSGETCGAASSASRTYCVCVDMAMIMVMIMTIKSNVQMLLP